MTNQEPVFLSSLELDQSKHEKKLFEALDILTIEDPSFLYEQESNTGQLVLKGLGELHLQIMRDRLNNEFEVGCSLSKLRVAYKEAAFAFTELSETFLQKIKGNPEFIELEGSVDSSLGFSLPNLSNTSVEKLGEGEARFFCEENRVTILLQDNNIIELAFFDAYEAASLFKDYASMRFQAEKSKKIAQNSANSGSNQSSAAVNAAYKSIYNPTKQEFLEDTIMVGAKQLQKIHIKSLKFEDIYAMLAIAINSLQRGPLLSKPMTDTVLRITGGNYTSESTSTIMIESTTNKFVHKLLKDSSPGIMEPVMDIEIQVGNAHLQTVMNDFLGTRKGKVEDVISAELTENRRNQNTIKGMIPSENIIGYANYLRQMTSVGLP